MPLRDDMFVPPPNPVPDLPGTRVHMVGARGTGMHTLAVAAQYLGAEVDGCDMYGDVPHPVLVDAGIDVAHGHSPDHVEDRHVVTNATIPADEPEIAAAAAAGRLHHRADLLDAVLRGRRSVGVTGTHGKGTVAALVGAALERLGTDPLVVVGANVTNFGSGVRLGTGPAVAEVDDADGSLARVHCDVAVMTNSWFDHPLFGRSQQEVLEDVARFLRNVPVGGSVVAGPGRNLRPLLRDLRAPVQVVGRDLHARTTGVGPGFEDVEVVDPAGVRHQVRVNVVGGNLADDVGLAFGALIALGVGTDDAAEALSALGGLSRRLELVGTKGGVNVYDDMGKHPESLRACLAAVQLRTQGRLHLVFEPFLHEDLLRWHRRWLEVLSMADTVLVLPVETRRFYPLGRTAPAGWADDLGPLVRYVAGRDDAATAAATKARAGDSVVVAGRVDDLAEVSRWILDQLHD